MDELFDVDVLVVGIGPMGATTALALATYGIRVQAVSKWNWVANTPRAHITNQRAVEILREFGLEEEAKKDATPWDQMGDSLFTTSLAGPEVARLRAWGTGDDRFGDYLRGSPCGNLDIPQPFMEPVLVNEAALRGAKVSFNVEYLGAVQDDTGVAVTLKDLISGTTYTRRVRYLVGADGANSQIARELDLPFVGTMARAGTVYAHFKADLSRYVAHRPSILHWILNPAGGFGEIGMGLLRAVRPWNEWIGGWGFDIAKGKPDLSQENALAKIRSLVGDPALACDFLGIAPWYVNQAYAEHYSVGRILCGGDAVHRHPPSSGLGSNTSMQDGFNLAWKLAMVIKGDAGPGLLETYSQERAPVGRQVVARANQSRVDYAPIRACFATTGSDDPVAAGLARVRAPTAEGAEVRAALRAALALKNTEFNAHGVELNQRYQSAAVIADEGAGEEVWLRDPQLYLQATSRPGAKLPHVWLVGRDGIRVSTLDLVGKGRFTLMTGLSGQAWRAATNRLGYGFLRLVVVGEDGARDPYAVWHDASETEEAGALLVRPDGYVAWRVRQAVWDAEQATKLLRNALTRVTCRIVSADHVEPLA
jgi:2,4-dichlorophenol 6-monooxygenase